MEFMTDLCIQHTTCHDFLMIQLLLIISNAKYTRFSFNLSSKFINKTGRLSPTSICGNYLYIYFFFRLCLFNISHNADEKFVKCCVSQLINSKKKRVINIFIN